MEDRDELRLLARGVHAHYLLRPDYDQQLGRRVRVGHSLLVWGVHPKQARPVPGCPRSYELFQKLRRIVRAVLIALRGELTVTEAPFNAALYDEPHIKRDAVLLLVQLVPTHPGEDADGLVRLQRGLRELDIRESAHAAP